MSAGSAARTAMGIRSVVAMVVTVAAVVLSAPPAAFADDIFCGTTVFDYGKVGLQGCMVDGQNDGDYYIPVASLDKVSPTTPSLWTACTARIALFIDNVQRRIEDQSCLYWAQHTGSSSYWGQIAYWEHGKCYRAVVRWFGTYNGSSVGSHVNAESPTFCP